MSELTREETLLPYHDAPVGTAFIQLHVGGWFDHEVVGPREVHLCWLTDRNGLGPILCGIDRFAKGGPGFSYCGTRWQQPTCPLCAAQAVCCEDCNAPGAVLGEREGADLCSKCADNRNEHNWQSAQEGRQL